MLIKQVKSERTKLRESLGKHPLFTKNASAIDSYIDNLDVTGQKALLKFLTKAIMSLTRDK